MSDASARIKSWFQGASLVWAVAGLAALLLLNLIFTPNFFHLEIRDGNLYGTLVDILNRGSEVMLLAIGMTLVISTGGVDLSVGSVMAIAGAVAALLAAKVAFVWIIAAALGAALAAGMCNGVLVGALGIQPIIATLILMVAGRGAAMMLTGGQVISFENPALVYLGNGHFLGLPFTVTWVAVVLCLALLITRKTAIGLFLESVGDNERAARLCGINVPIAKIIVYACSGLCAGMAGLIAAGNIKAADSMRAGEMRELDAIFAVVVGGTPLTGGRFTLVGSMIGGLLIQTLTTTLYSVSIHGHSVPPEVAPVPKALLVVAACLMQSAKFRAWLRALAGREAVA